MKFNNNKIIITILTSIGISFASNLYSQENKIDNLPISNNSAGMDLLKNTLNNNPNSKTAKILCAKVLLKNENFKEAEKLIMTILEEDPTNKKANILLKELNAAYSNYQKKLSEEQSNVNNEKEINEINIKEEILTEPKSNLKLSNNNSSNTNNKKKNNPKETQFIVTAEPLGSNDNVLILEEKVAEEKEKQEPEPEINNKKISNLLPTKEEILKKAKNRNKENQTDKTIENNILNLNTIEIKDTSFNEIEEKINSVKNNKVELLEPIIIKKEINEEFEEESTEITSETEKKTQF